MTFDTLTAIRQDHARLVEVLRDQDPFSDKPWARIALTIAASAIRRGRHLTPREQLENLARAFEEEPGDTAEERAESAAAAAWLRGNAERILRP